MLTFKKTNVLFSLLLIALIGYDLIYPFPLLIYIILVLLYLFILFYGSYFVDSGFFMNVICSAATTENEIAISFDDGPASEYSPQILDILKENQVHAAFFCIGKNISGKEELFRRYHGEGHLIGNHSYSHGTWFDLLSSRKMLMDLKQMDEAMQGLIGLRPRFFRPPYGVTNPNLRNAVLEGEYIPIGWNIRSLDTVIRNEKKLLKKVLNSLKPGSIVLFHDSSRTTLSILPVFIRETRELGYKITRLDKLLNLDPYV
ncbi:MAG: polysaccharide deacetylase family protein [Chitinophagales bacterium]